MANLGTLSVSLTANAAAFDSGLRKAQRSLNSFAGEATQSLGVMGVSIGSMIGNLAASAVSSAFGAAINIGQKVFEMGEGFIKAAASAELLRMQLNVLTGSADNGGKLFKELEQFAIATSFSFDEVTNQARTFLALGIQQSDVVDTLTLIGTLSMGDAERLRLLGKAYTDTMSKGTLRAQEMNQFAENNVNVMDALTKSMGKSRQEILRMREAGEITFTDLHNALVGMTTGQGQFAGLLNSMLDTTSGKWQSFEEQLAKISREFGEKLLPYANQFLEWLDESMPKIEEFAASMATATKDMIDAFRYAAAIFKTDIAPIVEQMTAALRIAGGGIAGLPGAVRNMAEAQRAIDAAQPPKPKAAAGPGIGNINPKAPDAPAAAFAGVGGMPGMFGGLLWEEQMRQTQAAMDVAKGIMVDDSYLTQGDKKQTQRNTAGALERGSQEAFSAIVNAMRGGKDPTVSAVNQVAAVLQNQVAKPLEAIKNEVKGGMAFNILTAEKI